MKKIRLSVVLILLCSIAIGSWLHAQSAPGQEQKTPQTASSPVVSWVSKTAGDNVTVENGTGAKLNIIISVTTDPLSEDPAGINLKNCGNTTHIGPGSSAVCVTNDIDHPVSFSSDKTTPATGTYQITQELPKG